MKTRTITVRLEEDLERMLEQVTQRSGRTRSEVVRDALRRQLSIAAFKQLRREVLPSAESRGYLTDEDMFRGIS